MNKNYLKGGEDHNKIVHTIFSTGNLWTIVFLLIITISITIVFINQLIQGLTPTAEFWLFINGTSIVLTLSLFLFVVSKSLSLSKQYIIFFKNILIILDVALNLYILFSVLIPALVCEDKLKSFNVDTTNIALGLLTLVGMGQFWFSMGMNMRSSILRSIRYILWPLPPAIAFVFVNRFLPILSRILSNKKIYRSPMPENIYKPEVEENPFRDILLPEHWSSVFQIDVPKYPFPPLAPFNRPMAVSTWLEPPRLHIDWLKPMYYKIEWIYAPPKVENTKFIDIFLPDHWVSIVNINKITEGIFDGMITLDGMIALFFHNHFISFYFVVILLKFSFGMVVLGSLPNLLASIANIITYIIKNIITYIITITSFK